MDPSDIERDLRELHRRVAALESLVGQAHGLPAELEPVPNVSGARPQAAHDELLPTIGRALLALAGAYLLRALVESEVLPTTAGVALGILYAVVWLIAAARTTQPLEAALHSLTSVLVLAPLLWEATLRFHAVTPWTAALTLLLFTLFGLAISWRKDLLIVATIATLAGLATAAGLLIATHDVVPFAFVFLATAAAIELSACLNHWLSERWLAAAAADLAVILATWLVTNPRGLPEGYAPIPHAWLTAAQLGLLALYLGSTIVRTLFRHFTFTAFETAQCAAAFAIVMSGGLPLAPAMLACGVACYLVSFLVLERGGGRNFYTYSTFGLLLLVAGSRVLMAGPTAVAVWSALAMACVWSRRLTLQVHGGLYLALACAAAPHSPLLALVAAVCYWGGSVSPLRVPLFAAFVWVFGDCAAVLAPAALRLPVKLLIYGAALIVLPRVRAFSPAAEPSSSETMPRPHDSVMRSGTASGAD